jgi:hypothetical protein
MRKLFIILAIIFTALGVLFTALRMNSLPFLPLGLAVINGILALLKSDESQKKTPRIILIIAGAAILITTVQVLFIKDEVAKDTQFEKVKIESKQEDIKDLEGLK